jgi:hypothetical protein
MKVEIETEKILEICRKEHPSSLDIALIQAVLKNIIEEKVEKDKIKKDLQLPK